jgi:hypothetical protein
VYLPLRQYVDTLLYAMSSVIFVKHNINIIYVSIQRVQKIHQRGHCTADVCLDKADQQLDFFVRGIRVN